MARLWIPYSICLTVATVYKGNIGLKALDLDSLGHLVGGQYIGIACAGFSFAALMDSGKMIGTDLWHLKWYCVLTAAIVCTLRYFGMLRIVFVLVGIALLWNCLSEKLTILCTKPLQFLGTISYVLYLIHQNIAYTIEYYLMKNIGHHWRNECIAFFVVLILAVVIQVGIEQMNRVENGR